MMAEVSRTLDAYSIHGHLAPGSASEELLDYETYFQELTGSATGVAYPVGTETVALVEAVSRGERFAVRFATGNALDLAEAFDPSSGTTAPVELGKERFIVSAAWIIVDPLKRIVVTERKRPGVPVYQLEQFLAKFGRDNGYPGLIISLNPVPSASFIKEIESFTRIREASVTVRRPNHSFTASAREAVAQIARDSNGGSATVQVNADRKQSLSKESGLVADIVSFAKNAISPVLNATVKGVRPGFAKERTVSLKKHSVKGTAQIETTASPLEQLQAIDTAAGALIEDASLTNEDSNSPS